MKVKWAKYIATTAILSILVTAPIGLLVISRLGPVMLTRDVPEAKSDRAGPLVDGDADEDENELEERTYESTPADEDLGGARRVDSHPLR